jgi:PAS domain-containing protein
VANGRDITERVEAEDLRRAQSELFEALVYNSSETVWVLDADGIIGWVKPLADGYRADEMIGQLNRDLFHPMMPGDGTTPWLGCSSKVTGRQQTSQFGVGFPRATAGWRYVSRTCSVMRQSKASWPTAGMSPNAETSNRSWNIRPTMTL